MTEKSLAAVSTDILTTQLQEIDLPEIEDDSGLLQLEAAGICGSDWKSYQSKKTPRIMGHENVGRVIKIGKLAEQNWDLKEGDRIALEEYLPCGQCAICRTGDFRLCRKTETRGPEGTWLRYGTSAITVPPALWGGYSHYMYLHPRAVIHRVKDDVPAHHLAMAIPMSNGIQWTQYDAGLRMGQTVLIQGPGQQGLAAVLAAKRLGAEKIIVSGLSRDARRLEIARTFGADVTIDVEKEDLIETVYDATDGQGVDAALDLAGAPEAIVNGIRCVKKTGIVIFAAGGQIENFPANEMTSKRVTLRAVRGHSYQAVEKAIAFISSGEYDLDLMATHQFGLDEVDLGIKSIGGEGVEGAIHVSIIPSRTT